ncbi:MAG: type II toxin-antitoxin system ParD family antitoxin [Acetobacteraceae bacterium]|nr:type II toxin-antitoxin system ParD family antitoxin [Acetobacteraceae bacterium]
MALERIAEFQVAAEYVEALVAAERGRLVGGGTIGNVGLSSGRQICPPSACQGTTSAKQPSRTAFPPRARPSGVDCPQILSGLESVTLPPELERFATEAVAAGRYRHVSSVVAAGVRLLQRQAEARSAFAGSLEEAIAAGERDGFCSIEDVEREMDAIIAEVLAERK